MGGCRTARRKSARETPSSTSDSTTSWPALHLPLHHHLLLVSAPRRTTTPSLDPDCMLVVLATPFPILFPLSQRTVHPGDRRCLAFFCRCCGAPNPCDSTFIITCRLPYWNRLSTKVVTRAPHHSARRQACTGAVSVYGRGGKMMRTR
jgi:hypothetical protein